MNTSKPTIAVLGTGILGTPIARNLARVGYPVRAWNRTPAKARPLADDGATVAQTPAEAVDGAGVILTVLYDADATRAAIEAAAPGLERGAVWADMGTLGVDQVEPLAELARTHELVFVDAPVQGARPLAEKGQLLIYAVGPDEVRPVLEPIFDVLGRRTDWLEGPKEATALKLVVQSWVYALTAAAGEAVALARGLGVDPERFRAAIEGGPLDNAWAQLKSASIIEGDFAPVFPVRGAAKDTALIAAAADAAGVRVDLAAAARERFERAAARGHAEDDIAAAYFAS